MAFLKMITGGILFCACMASMTGSETEEVLPMILTALVFALLVIAEEIKLGRKTP